MIIDTTPKLDFDDVLISPARSKNASRKDVNLHRQFKFYHSPREFYGLPIVASNMDTTGTFAMASAFREHCAVVALHKHYCPDKVFAYFDKTKIDAQEFAWVSVGIKRKDFEFVKHLNERLTYEVNIVVDVANGYTENFVNACKKFRKLSPNSIIMAGNVASGEMVNELILHGGVDIVKVGIGPGSACTTRLKTGVGVPQLSAIIECAQAAHGLKSAEGRMGLICADGGLRTPADVCKAFCANTDFVMAGGLFAGTDECEGQWEYDKENVKKFFTFYGMSSKKAQLTYGGFDEYKTSEGRVKKIPYKGPVESVLRDIKGGMASCGAYIGATRLKDFSKCARMIVVNRPHFDRSL